MYTVGALMTYAFKQTFSQQFIYKPSSKTKLKKTNKQGKSLSHVHGLPLTSEWHLCSN